MFHFIRRSAPCRRKALIPAATDSKRAGRRGAIGAVAIRSALAAALAATAASADYSPLRIGRTWVYAGAGVHVPATGDYVNGRLKVMQYREALSLTVTRMRNQGGAITYTIEERDSLFDRKFAWWNWAGSNPDSTSLPDSVIVRTLTYIQDTAMHLEKGDSLALGHYSSPDPFFPTLSSSPPGATALNGLAEPYQGVQKTISQGGWMGRFHVFGTVWYLDGFGLYWMRIGASQSTCDEPWKRELLLKSMDGKPVDPGLAPPGSALAKESRVACGLRRPGRPGAFTIGAADRGTDALGRSLAPRMEGPRSLARSP